MPDPLPLTSAAVVFAWDALVARGGLPADLRLHYGPAAGRPVGKPAVCVLPAPAGAWEALLARPDHSLDWLPASATLPPGQNLPVGERLPVLFWGGAAETGRFAALRDAQTLIVHVDVIAAALFMLSRWEETVSEVRDVHGRFPAEASVAWRQGFLDRPVVDEYALVLGAWLQTLLPGWSPTPRRFAVALHHDIDTLRRFSPAAGLLAPRGGLRSAAADLLIERSPRRAARTLREIAVSRSRPAEGQALAGLARLAALATRYRLPATFFFMTADPSPRDVGYRLDDALGRQSLAIVRDAGHALGFHPGYATPDSAQRRQDELRRFQEATGELQPVVRQHYLRLRIPETWRQWAAAGLPADATLGYGAQPGFRAGTCHPFRPFDLEQDTPIGIEVRPLVVMDQTLISRAYLHLPPQEVVAQVKQLAQRCRAVAGTFTLLWHNTMLAPPWDACYVSILTLLRTLLDESDDDR